MSAIVELVGPKVKGKDKDVDTSEFTGEGKVVGKMYIFFYQFYLFI